MRIRVADHSDLAEICQIYNHAVINTAATFDTEVKREDYFLEFLEDKEYFHYLCVAEDESRVIGYAGLYPFSRRKAYAGMSELTCYVDPECHGKSVGTAMCEQVGKYAEASGLHTVISLFNSQNIAMRQVCLKLGYAFKGEMSEVAFKLGGYQSLSIYQKFMRRK